MPDKPVETRTTELETGASGHLCRQTTMRKSFAMMAALSKATAFIIVLGRCIASSAEEKETGTPEAPASPAALAGSYFRGKGLAYNFHLRLEAGGQFTAKWHSCLYKSGEASGNWSLSDNRITFSPPIEGEMLQRPMESLTVLKFKGQWVLAPTE